MTEPLVTVLTPVHPERERNGMLDRCAVSVAAQTVPVLHLIEYDMERRGAAITRQRGLERVTTPWVMFLDSDDRMDPECVERCLSHAQETGADYVYPWFRVEGGGDPFPMFFGKPWDDDAPHCTTITVLVRTGLAQQVGFSHDPNATAVSGEDWIFTLGCVALGAQISHLPEILWTYVHHGRNSSGLPGRGDAA